MPTSGQQGSLPAAKIEFLSRHDFKGLIFGASSSAFQYEGAADKDGRGKSIWDTFIEKKCPELLEQKALDAIKHYDNYKEDIKIMKQMGLDSYRFSISWPRVLPNGRWNKETEEGVNGKGIDFYKNLIDELIHNKIEPVVTLFHWDFPQALEDEYKGFLSEKVVEDFKNYADLCFKKFGDRVTKWVTFNETWTYSMGGYAMGSCAPGRGGNANFFMSEILPSSKITSLSKSEPKGGDPNSKPNEEDSASKSNEGDSNPKPDPYTEIYKVTHNQLLAHAATVKLYREKYVGKEKQNGQIGIILVSIWALPYYEGNPEDEIAASRAMDFMLGWLLKPITSGDYPEVMREELGPRLPTFNPAETESLIKSFDFIGLNYYTANYVSPYKHDKPRIKYNIDSQVICHMTRNGQPIGEKGGSFWLYSYPQGLKHLLLHIKEKYDNPPVYITENGFDEVNDKNAPFWEGLYDYKRVSYHYTHLLALKEAISQGANVKGYFMWSLMDNLEFASGFETRFGLNFIHYEGKYERIPKLSAWWFKVLLQK